MSKNNKNQTSVYVVANRKGGAGKSTLSSMILPALIGTSKPINVFEIDDNNRTKLTSSHVNFKSIKIEQSEDAIGDVSFDLIAGENVVNIVDCGGGNDTLAVLRKIHENNLMGLTYFVPTNDDIEQFDNVKQTINEIKKIDPTSRVYLVFNRISVMEEDKIKKQFVAFFGDETYSIEGRIDEIKNLIEDMFFVENTSLFGILKNIYGKTLLDSFIDGKDMVDNLEKYKVEWSALGRERYKINLGVAKFAKSVVELVEQLAPFKKAL